MPGSGAGTKVEGGLTFTPNYELFNLNYNASGQRPAARTVPGFPG